MTMTLVERSIPPSPPQSSDGHPPHESFEGYGMYHPAYNSTKMSEEISTGQLQSMAGLYPSCYLATRLTFPALWFSTTILPTHQHFPLKRANTLGKLGHIVTCLSMKLTRTGNR